MVKQFVVKQKEQFSRSHDSFVTKPRRDRRLLVFVILSALLTTQIASCAYYNTFYSARRYYQDAMRAKERQAKSKGTSTTSVSSSTLPGQASGLLDRAIEKCAKVISVYPKSKWVDDAVFLLGACYYEKRDYDKAIKKFNELNMYYPKSSLIRRAQFLTGMCYLGKNDYDQSCQILERHLSEHPHSSDREAALYALGDDFFYQKRYAEALPYYRLLTGHKKSALYFSTLSKIGECYFETAKYDSSRASFSAVVAKSADDEQVLDAIIKIGDSYGSEKNFDAAVKEYEKSLPLAKEFAKTHIVKLKMASIIAQKGDYKKAIEVYQSVVDESPRTIQASEAQFRIGYIHEVNLEDLESASTAYNRVKDHSSRSEFALLADLRSKGLAKLKEFNQTAQSSEGEKAAESAFLIAELSLFQLGKPDKAIERYLSVEKDFPKTSFAPKSAYAAAYVFLYMKQDTASAVDVLKRIVERFPSSEYTAAAADILRSLGIEPPESKAIELSPQELPEQAKSAEQGKIQETGKELAIPQTGKELEAPPDTLGSEIRSELATSADTLRSQKLLEETKVPGSPPDTLRNETR